MTGQISIPVEAARVQELAYLCGLHPGEEIRRAGRIMPFKYPSASPRRRGRTAFPRAHTAAVAPEYPVIFEGAWREMKIEEPAAIAEE